MAGASAVAAARSIVNPDLDNRSSAKSTPGWYLFFFVSGFPALLYQIVWQRSLFTLYGVNIESVTMVVTAFMLGLGLGSLLGGVISRSRRFSLLAVFGVVELLIGAYGILSLKIFHWAANFTAGSAPFETGLVAFTLVAFPTVLMGSTLPVLVSYRVRFCHNVGTSVGELYAANTMGSAVACFCAGMFLMRWLGESKTVALAASFNAVVGAGVLIWHLFSRERESQQAQSSVESWQDESASENSRLDIKEAPGLAFALALVAAGIAGFISLGYEIVWYRLFSFTTAGVAKSFAYLLGAYLAGIAAGSMASNRICDRIEHPRSFIRFLMAVVFAANLLGFLVGPILFNLVRHVSYLYSLVPIGIAAAGLGAVFPLLCHISIAPDEQVGTRTSYLYLANIVGSVLGSYLTGFVLMDVLPLREVCVILTLLGLGLGAILMLKAQFGKVGLTLLALAVSLSAVFVIRTSAPLFSGMYEKMLAKSSYRSRMHFAATVETRNGDIAVTKDGIVFGGGIYDGRFNVSLVNDTNGIQRAFALSYYHPNPKEVLMIGLSSGSWAQVIANHPQVEHLTIVEINPGYLRLIREMPSVASLLRNPKVRIDIDDGRRWLVRNPGRKFDAVVMNTSYNWRSNMTNLISVEFLELVRQHLNPGGVHVYNTTDSDEALATGVNVFPFGMRLGNFMVVSDSQLRLDAKRWLDILSSYSIDGKPVFDLSQPQDRQRLAEVMAMTTTMDGTATGPFTLESAYHIRLRTANVRAITDDNMGTEWER